MKLGAYDDIHTHVARARPAWTTRPGWRAPRARHTRSSLVLCGLVLAAVVSTQWVRLNVSPSVPLGLYRLTAVPTPVEHGMLVVWPVPASVQHVWSRWVPLLKPVAGIAGDVVCVWGATLWVWTDTAGADPAWYGPVWREAHGTLLPQWTGCQVIPEGQVLLASRLPTSMDGRYFGPTPIADLTAQAVPLLTWR